MSGPRRPLRRPTRRPTTLRELAQGRGRDTLSDEPTQPSLDPLDALPRNLQVDELDPLARNVIDERSELTQILYALEGLALDVRRLSSMARAGDHREQIERARQIIALRREAAELIRDARYAGILPREMAQRLGLEPTHPSHSAAGPTPPPPQRVPSIVPHTTPARLPRFDDDDADPLYHTGPLLSDDDDDDAADADTAIPWPRRDSVPPVPAVNTWPQPDDAETVIPDAPAEPGRLTSGWSTTLDHLFPGRRRR